MAHKHFTHLALLLGALCMLPSAAFADFLGSWKLYDFPEGYSGIPAVGITGIRLRVAFGPTAGFSSGPDLFEASQLTFADIGHPLVADALTDPDFSTISAQLTNGNSDDEVNVYYLILPFLEGGGAPWTEAYWATRPGSTAPADFSGYHLDRIELVPEYIFWTSPGHNSNGDGIYTDYFTDGRLDFYGSAVPEPTAIVIATMASCVLVAHRRSRHHL